MGGENMINSDTKIMRNSDIISSEMDEETVMMNIEQGEYYGVNPVGSRIWELLETPWTFGSLCAQLRKEFDVSEEECKRDVGEFVNVMREKNLVLLDEA